MMLVDGFPLESRQSKSSLLVAGVVHRIARFIKRLNGSRDKVQWQSYVNTTRNYGNAYDHRPNKLLSASREGLLSMKLIVSLGVVEECY